MDKILILIIVGISLFILFSLVILFGKRFSLNRIKSKTVGDGQHGVARWLKESEKSKVYRRVPYLVNEWRDSKKCNSDIDYNLPQGIVVGFEESQNTKYALVDDGDVHALMIGAAGVGKTAYFLYPNLEYSCASGMSFITSDTKGDLYRNYGKIAKDYYNYNVAVIDLRNPTKSDGNNLLHLVNKYMDLWKEHPDNLVYKAKSEKYAKIIAKTIIQAGNTESSYGQNAFFYDAAEGLITSAILLVAEFCEPAQRHIVSVFKLIQDLMNKSKKVRGSNGFQDLINRLPENHKAKWFAGAALNASDGAMSSVMSTALSRLNSFLDSELEQVLCFDTAIDAESFCENKSAIFIVMPEEDNSKHFMVSLIIQQLYREILSYADELGGKLKNRVMMYLDEFGTIPRIESAEMMFSASRSRKISIVAIIQSFAQLNKNYGDDGCEIIVDNTQLTIFGGFAPNSSSADKLSKALGNRTVMSGNINIGREDATECLQMIERALLSPDELKSLNKGTFVVMKTGSYPMMIKLKLFYEWGINFFDTPYVVPEKGNREVEYVSPEKVLEEINKKYGQNINHESENEKETKPKTRKKSSKMVIEKNVGIFE